MAANIEALRDEYAALLPSYKLLARTVARRLTTLLKAGGIPATVSWRCKEPASLQKKAIRLGATDLDAIADCAGVRVVVSFTWQTHEVSRLIHDSFVDVNEELVGARLGTNQLGYIATHFLVTPPRLATPDGAPRRCEIQVQTQAQSAWAVVSHDLIYKPVGQPPAPSVERRLNRSAALVELFDDEAKAAYETIRGDPSFVPGLMLQELERHFWRLTSARFDRELSLFVLQTIRSSYLKTELDRFSSLISGFLTREESTLTALYKAYRDDPNADPLLAQPETIAIFERLSSSGLRLRAAWDKKLDPSLLTSISEVLGLPV